MKWSWKLGEFRGIGVYLHFTFFILLAFIAIQHWADGKSVGQTLEGLAFILALFTCVVLHEFGHALMAARFGIPTRDITLLPIGGVARLERMPEKPSQELWVALAGPAVNVVIAAGLWVCLGLSSKFSALGETRFTAVPFLERLLIVNVMLVLFNLLPAFPMDGGRVLRALLATRLEYSQATRIAANVGQMMALLFGVIGLFYNPFLVFIALFVWLGAAQESGVVQIKSALGGIPVTRAMITDFQTVRPQDPLDKVIHLTMTSSQRDFPVTDGQTVVGVLTQGDLLAGLTSRGPGSFVEDAMQSEFLTVDASEMLENAFARLQTCQCHTVPVVRQGELVGLVTMDNVGEFIAIQGAIDRVARRS